MRYFPILSKEVASAHFCNHVLPRYSFTVDEQIRRVLKHEENRGHLYSLFKFIVASTSHFGAGIFIYFFQLVFMSCTFFASGLIIVPIMSSYYFQSNGLTFLGPSCNSVQIVATSLCPLNSNNCSATLRTDCPLTNTMIVTDMALCLFLLLLIPLSKIIDQYIIERLDKSVQTAADYTIEVFDPNPDANDPDEWMQYFSRFGEVKYVTVAKCNRILVDLLFRKYNLLLQLNWFNSTSMDVARKINSNYDDYLYEQPNGCNSNYHIFHNAVPKVLGQLKEIEVDLERACTIAYPVNRIYVTFKFEEHRRLALNTLEVPDFNAFSDNFYQSKTRQLFRGNNILQVKQAPEPDIIDWDNIQFSQATKTTRSIGINLFVLVLLIAAYVAINLIKESDQRLLPIVTGFISLIFPKIYEVLARYECKDTEGQYLRSLHLKSFFSQLLITTIFSYTTTGWDNFLDSTKLQLLIQTQLITCFLMPCITVLHIPALLKQHLFAPLFSSTQYEFNQWWSGTKWSLSNRYVEISKITFISLFYSFIMPISLFVASIAFIVQFAFDRYSLLRKWSPVPMLDAAVASEMKKEFLLAITFHMYVTSRFIYSWPMDSAVAMTNGTDVEYKYVDRTPSFLPWNLTVKEYMTDTQKQLLPPYVAFLTIVLAITLYQWFFENGLQYIFNLYFLNIDKVATTIHIPYSSVHGIKTYTPVYRPSHGIDEYITADTSDMLLRHRWELDRGGLRATAGNNLAYLIPLNSRKKVLSEIKWYDNDVVSCILNPTLNFETASNVICLNNSDFQRRKNELNSAVSNLSSIEGKKDNMSRIKYTHPIKSKMVTRSIISKRIGSVRGDYTSQRNLFNSKRRLKRRRNSSNVTSIVPQDFSFENTLPLNPIMS